MNTTAHGFSCELTFYPKVENLRAVQDLVKKTNGRFIGSPLVLWGNAEVKVGFMEVSDMNEFHKCCEGL